MKHNHHTLQTDKNKFSLVTKFHTHNLTSEESDEPCFSDVWKYHQQLWDICRVCCGFYPWNNQIKL